MAAASTLKRKADVDPGEPPTPDKKLKETSDKDGKKPLPGPRFYSFAEEMELGKAAAKAPLLVPEERIPKRRKGLSKLGIFTDIEGRSGIISDGPPSAIAALAGVMVKGKYSVEAFHDDKILMPVTAKWDPSTARFWFRKGKLGGGGEKVMEIGTEEAKEPHEAIRRYIRFVRGWQDEMTVDPDLIGDAITYDYTCIDYWRDILEGGKVYPLNYELGYRDYHPPKHVSDYVQSIRHSAGSKPFDPKDKDASYAALTTLGFKHDHNAFNDIQHMYARAFICAFYETTVENAGKDNEKRYYDVAQLRKDGVVPATKKSILAKMDKRAADKAPPKAAAAAPAAAAAAPPPPAAVGK